MIILLRYIVKDSRTGLFTLLEMVIYGPSSVFKIYLINCINHEMRYYHNSS